MTRAGTQSSGWGCLFTAWRCHVLGSLGIWSFPDWMVRAMGHLGPELVHSIAAPSCARPGPLSPLQTLTKGSSCRGQHVVRTGTVPLISLSSSGRDRPGQIVPLCLVSNAQPLLLGKLPWGTCARGGLGHWWDGSLPR